MLLKEKEREQIRSQIDLVECYLEDEEKIDVVYDHDFPSGFCDDHIVINTRQNLRYQLHTLLHEAGHAFVRADPEFEEKFSGLFKKKRSKHHKVDTLREEILAWEKGLELANVLGLDIDRTWWERHSSQCLYDYIKWASG